MSMLPARMAALLHTSSRASSAAAGTGIHKKNYKRDIVYLYQFPRSKYTPNLSPYCLKLESYLRIKSIKYEVCETYTKRSKYGLLPFVELNGEHHADSHLIIQRLEKHFGTQENLVGESRGIARAIDRMLDGSTLHAIQMDRVIRNSARFVSRDVSGLPLPGFVTSLLSKRVARTVEGRMRRVFGRMSADEITEVLKRDLQAIDDILGEKRFLFGDVPTVTDCAVFGHIASCAYLPYRQALTDFLEDDFHSLRGLIARFRAHYYPEWEEEYRC